MKYKVFLLILLGMLTAFGPFVTDMYLPALPTMTGYFGTSVSMVQLGLTFSMIGLALGQLLVGPVSDKYGRRRPLIASMVLFIISTVACIFSPDVVFFTAMRYGTPYPLFHDEVRAGTGAATEKTSATTVFTSTTIGKTSTTIEIPVAATENPIAAT